MGNAITARIWLLVVNVLRKLQEELILFYDSALKWRSLGPYELANRTAFIAFGVQWDRGG